MQKITKRVKPHRPAVIIPMTSMLEQLYLTRCASISKMSGYPSALHAIGRLQRTIDTSSYEAFINSLIRLYNIVSLTADVLDSMDGVRVDRYQLNRVEIIAYVKNISENYTSYQAKADDTDIIANLIVAFEANPHSWNLQGGTISSENFHIKFKNLYKQVLRDDEDKNLHVYISGQGAAVPIADTDVMRTLNKEMASDNKKVADAAKDAKNTAMLTHRLAACRIIDHIYQLLMDREIWYQFMAPRTGENVAANLERSRTLKVFALYLQSVLIYPHFLGLEMFLEAYNTLQKWVMSFPPLPDETIKELEHTIRPHDFLNAQGDARSLFNSFSSISSSELDAIAYPQEFIGTFGIKEKLNTLKGKAKDMTLSGDLTTLKALNDQKYVALIAGVAISDINTATDMATYIIKDKQVANEVRKAVLNLVPSLTRGAGKNIIDGLRELNINCSIPFVIPAVPTLMIDRGVTKGITGGNIYFDSGAPDFAYDYHKYIRKDLAFKVFTDTQIPTKYKGFHTPQVPDYDKATLLRSIFEYEWKTLNPATQFNGDRTYKDTDLKDSPETIRNLIETFTGQDYEIFSTQLSLPHLQRIWATYLSSFALVYTNAKLDKKLIDSDGKFVKTEIPTDFALVEGHGKPYGTTYSELEAKQGVLTPDTELIPIGGTIFIRFLTKIPIVHDELRIDDTPFYNGRFIPHFSSNSETIEVTSWVIGESLLNFTMLPAPKPLEIPPLLITSRWAYLNTNLYINMDIAYKPSAPDKPREVIPINLVETAWPYDFHQPFLKYIHFGKYASPAGVVQVPDNTEKIADVVKKIENEIKQGEKESAESVKEAGGASKHAIAAVKEEAKGTKERESTRSSSSDEGALSI